MHMHEAVGETSQTLADKKAADNRQTEEIQQRAKFRSGNA